MNYVKTKNISNIYKENELHIINIIQSNRKNKLENPLNNILYNYHKGRIKKKDNKEKLSINFSTGIFRKKIQKGSKSPSCKEKIHHALSVKSHNNEINIRLSLNSDGNNTNSYMNNTNSKNITTYEEIIREKDLLITKLKNEIKINNEILSQITEKKLNFNDNNLLKTKSSSNISSKNSNKQIFIFTDLIRQTKRKKIHTSRYKSKIIMETENMKNHNKFIPKRKKYIHPNFSGINSERLTYHNSDSNLININNLNKDRNQGYNNDIFSNICFNILERTKNICLKYKQISLKNKTINPSQ